MGLAPSFTSGLSQRDGDYRRVSTAPHGLTRPRVSSDNLFNSSASLYPAHSAIPSSVQLSVHRHRNQPAQSTKLRDDSGSKLL